MHKAAHLENFQRQNLGTASLSSSGLNRKLGLFIVLAHSSHSVREHIHTQPQEKARGRLTLPYRGTGSFYFCDPELRPFSAYS